MTLANCVVKEGLLEMQLDEVCGWLQSSYWGNNSSAEEITRSIINSTLVLGAFFLDCQVGFLRVVSDKARFAYLADVWTAEKHRGQGVATKLIQHALNHPDFVDVGRWLLSTADQQDFYARFGFKVVTNPGRMMIRDRLLR